jgi:hypothetical protein
MRLLFMTVFAGLLLTLNSTPVQAQQLTQTLRGRVIDAYTEQPLQGVTITITGTDPPKGTATDAEGYFRFSNLPLGRTDLEASLIGYRTEVKNNLLLISGRELIVDFRLEEQVITMEDVVIRPDPRKDQPSNEMASVSARSFTIDETERYAGSLGDPSRMATNFAGVSSVSDQRNDIVIRGNSPLGLLWCLEGVEIPNPNHFGSLGSSGGPISMLNNNQLANSDFYTSAFPAEYGNALSGAFDLRMRNGNSQQHEFMGQVGFNGLELGAEGPLSVSDHASYLINFRYSALEILHSLGMNFGTGAAIPRYKDMSMKVNIPLDKGRISMFALGGNSRIAMLDSEGDDAQYGFSGTDTYYRNMMGVAGLSYVRYLGQDTRLTSIVSVSGIEGSAEIYDLGNDIRRQVIDEKMQEIKYTLSGKLRKRFSSRNYLNTGLVFDFYDVKYKGAQYQESIGEFIHYLNSDRTTRLARLISEWMHRFTDELTVTAGLNSAWFLLNDSKSLEPRLGMKWSFAPGQSLSLGTGLHSQTQVKAVYFNQRLIDTIDCQYEKTNEHLDFSRSLHIVTGYDCLLGEGHRLKAEIYYQRLFNIPVSWRRPEYSLLNQGGAFSFLVYDNMENTGTGENKGIELTLERFLREGFYYLATISLFDSGYRGYDGRWRNTTFDNNFVCNALAGFEWKTGKRALLSADLKMVYAGGNRYLEIDEERSLTEGGVRYRWDQAYKKRYPDYFRLNGRITFRLNRPRVNHEWALDLQNMTNHRNIFTRNWNNVTKEVTTSWQMGFMPMVTYRIYI